MKEIKPGDILVPVGIVKGEPLREGIKVEIRDPKELAGLFGITVEEYRRRFPEPFEAPPLYITKIDLENKIVTLGPKPPEEKV